MIQQVTGLFAFEKLSGVVEEAKKPAWTWKDYRSGKWQRKNEAYLRQHYGFREPLTRLYNQCVWDLFGTSNQFKFRNLYMGDEHWLFEKENVQEHYMGNGLRYAKDSLEMVRKLDEEAFRISQLHRILEGYGVQLFVLLEPGKELIYPERVPATDDYEAVPHRSALDHYRRRFQELEVPCFDVAQWFLQIKDSVDYPLYPVTGTHWSNYASMHVADSLIHFLEQLGDLRLQHFSIGEPYVKTVEPDDDLEKLLNLARPLKKAPNYFADTEFHPDTTADQPVLITVGDSYYWNLLNATPFYQSFQATPYWYYYSSAYLNEPYHHVSEIDVVHEVLSADFVMLAYSTTQIYKMSNQFSQDLLVKFCCDDEVVEEAVRQCEQQIRKSPKWLDNLKARTEPYHIPLDEAIAGEARNNVKAHPERYIPALRDSIPQTRSTKAQQYGIQ